MPYKNKLKQDVKNGKKEMDIDHAVADWIGTELQPPYKSVRFAPACPRTLSLEA